MKLTIVFVYCQLLLLDSIMILNYSTLYSILAVFTISSYAGKTFKPYNEELTPDSYFEQFDNSWKSRWIPSKATKDDKLSYEGKWEVEESIVLRAYDKDLGLVTKTEAALHAISAKLPHTFDNTNNTLVLQYEVKFQNGLNCGGAYIKLLADGFEDDGEHFSDKTPYVVMFGPDKCGGDNKVHFILNLLNKEKNTFEEHQLLNPPMAKLTQATSLYTLIIEPNQDFQIRINGDIVRSGNLFHFFDFDTIPPREIPDENDVKPKNWVDDNFIPDPNDVKPDDWDEDAPYWVDDLNAVKPDTWNEEEPLEIPDPDHPKPEDWDDEEDGVWNQKMIRNPKCKGLNGCGKWIRPKIKNKNYKGKWKPKMISNPKYKGEWKPRLIPNPHYHNKDNLKISNLSPIGGIGIEIWTMDKNILFDNIYLGHSINEAEKIGNSTFLPKLEIELELLNDNEPIDNIDTDQLKTYHSKGILSGINDYIFSQIASFIEDLQIYVVDAIEKPLETLLQRPGEAFFFSSIIVTTCGVIIGFWTVLINISLLLFRRIIDSKETKINKQKATSTKKSSGKASSFKRNKTKANKR